MAFENGTKERIVREDEASICPNATLRGVWKTSGPARLVFSTTPYPRHLLYIRSSCSVFEVSNLYPSHLARIQSAGFVCATPALYPKPICPASHTAMNLHISILPRGRSPGISAPVPASSSFPLPPLLRPALHATESLYSDMGAHASLSLL